MNALLRAHRRWFGWAAAMSAALNVLLLVPSLYMLQVFDRVLTARHVETLAMLSILVAASLVAGWVFDLLRARLLAGAAAALERELGPTVFEAMLEASRAPGGTGLAAAGAGMADLGTLRGFLTGPAVLAVLDVPWLPVYLGLIWVFHPVMGALATAGGLVLVALAWANESATSAAFARAADHGRSARLVLDQALRNADVVRAHGATEAVVRRWRAAQDAQLAAHLEGTAGGLRYASLIRTVRQGLQSAMLAAGAWLVIEQHATPGIMIAGTILLGRALAPVETGVSSWRMLRDAWRAARRLASLPPAGEAPGVGPVPQPSALTALPDPRGELRCEGASFTLREAGRVVLRPVSFAIDAGEALAIVGPSGSGKSTLARLLANVWVPTGGTVRLDGADLRQWAPAALGRHVGYLPQEVALFAGTVAENIARMGVPDDTRVIEAARRAHLHETILRLPQGYDTQIGDGGRLLSGGQRQRIALARALYGDPVLVVLDEPNSSLDGDGEDALMRALQDLRERGTTVVMVTHRPALLARAGRVLVLEDGAVQSFSTRDEFLARMQRAARVANVAPRSVEA